MFLQGSKLLIVDSVLCKVYENVQNYGGSFSEGDLSGCPVKHLLCNLKKALESAG